MPYSTLPIVGAFFRPPAPALIAHLSVGTPLLLMAEPENHHDRNAVAVFLRSENIPLAAHASLAEALAKTGHTIDGVLGEPYHHLGYIPKDFAAQLRATGTVPDNENIPVTFAVAADGKPRVRFAEPVL